MTEGKRQRQVAGVLQEALNDIFQRLSLGMMQGGMVSISSVKVTPDLLEARIYISLFQVADPEQAMKTIESRAWEIKKELSQRVKHQLRRIPVLHFYRDDTLDYVFKMEEIFKNMTTQDNTKEDKS
ncbi:MAG: 30S ribosome-binding factor RbfA [Bacteroidota bacterium]|jgi:ribosome-binding factor A